MSIEGFKVYFDEGGGGSLPISEKVAKTDQALAQTEEERFALSKKHLQGKLARRQLDQRVTKEEEKLKGGRVIQGMNSD